jgi:flagellar biosynthesis protein FliQ
MTALPQRQERIPMDAAQVFTIGQQALYTLLTVAAPVLLAVLVVGILVSIFQAATQINEATLTFVPRQRPDLISRPPRQ